MASVLLNNDILFIEYCEKQDLIFSHFKDFGTVENYITGIKQYKVLFEKIYPKKVLWDLSDFEMILSNDLQNWIYNFLDKPASETGRTFEVGHIVPQAKLVQASVMDIYAQNDPLSFYPRYFAHVDQAKIYLGKKLSQIDDHKLSLTNNHQTQRAELRLDIPI